MFWCGVRFGLFCEGVLSGLFGVVYCGFLCGCGVGGLVCLGVCLVWVLFMLRCVYLIGDCGLVLVVGCL